MNAAPQAPPVHRLLVVDNDHDCADAVCELLRMTSDWDVEAAYDMDDALSHAAAHRPDAVLLDLEMEGGDGFRTADCLIEALAVRLPRLVALTGNSNLQIEASHDRRFAEALLKPVDNLHLLTLLARFAAATVAPGR
jgi:CheY-like chemotaxis protein